METLSGIAIFILSVALSAIASVIIAIIFTDKISYFLTNLFGSSVSKPRRKIAGIWYSIFWFTGKTGTIIHKQNIVKISAIGGRFSAKTIVGEDHHIIFWGSTKQDIYASGIWEHTEPENFYHGSFHFVIDPEGDRLHGKWLGFNKKQIVAMGPWILVKLNNEKNIFNKELLKTTYSRDDLVKLELLPSQIQNVVNELIEQQIKKETNTTWRKIKTYDNGK